MFVFSATTLLGMLSAINIFYDEKRRGSENDKSCLDTESVLDLINKVVQFAFT